MSLLSIPFAINPYLLGGGKKKTTAKAPKTTTAPPPATTEVAEEEKKKVKRGMPKRSTLLTSPLGLSGGPKTGLKTLLGE